MDPGLITTGALAAFLEILFIDIVLAGDNAIVVGALAAGLPAEQRRKVILIGVLAALVLRVAFAWSSRSSCRSSASCSPAASCCCGSPGACTARSATRTKARVRTRSPGTSIRA